MCHEGLHVLIFDEMAHTSYISKNNVSKDLSLRIRIFDMKMIVRSTVPLKSHSNPTCLYKVTAAQG